MMNIDCHLLFIFEQFTKLRKCNFSVSIPEKAGNWPTILYYFLQIQWIKNLKNCESCQFLLPVEFVHEGLGLDWVHVSEASELAHRDVPAAILVNGLERILKASTE